MTVNQHGQHQDPESEAGNYNSTIMRFIIDTCAFLAVVCQNVVYSMSLCVKQIFYKTNL